MNKIKLAILLVTICLWIQACKNPPSPPARPSETIGSLKKKSPGRIEFTEEMHNFGTLKEGETIVFSFRFRNKGTGSLSLTKVEPTCGCLSVQYKREDIASEEDASVDVIFNTTGEWGNQIKSVNIETSDGEKKTLMVGAYVENKNFNSEINN